MSSSPPLPLRVFAVGGFTIAAFGLQWAAGCSSTAPRPSEPSPIAQPVSEAGAVVTCGAGEQFVESEGCARVKQLALGAYFSCALIEGGQVACFGDNSLGQLGTNSPEMSSRPLRVPGVEDATQIAAGYATACARSESGGAMCWGGNSHGQARPVRRQAPGKECAPGADCPLNEPPGYDLRRIERTPVSLDAPAGIQQLSLGMRHGCALLVTGRVWCWGDNSAAQVSHEAPRTALQARLVPGLPAAVEVRSAGTYSCALTAAGEVWCWGTLGQLGGNAAQPRRVELEAPAAGLSLGATRACARLRDGGWSCWGSADVCPDGETAAAAAGAPPLAAATQLAHVSGACFACVLDSTHLLECPREQSSAVRMPGVQSAAAGYEHACALLLDGSVQCWGSNVRGELGRRTPDRYDADPASVSW